MSIFDRKLSDLTVGDVAKGYAVYWVVGSIAALIVAIVGFSMLSSFKDEADSQFGSFGAPGPSASLETSPSDHQVTRAEYRAVATGTPKDDVVDRFGDPGGTGPDIYDLSGSGSQDCLVYSRATSSGSSYLFCFDDRERLVSKRGI